MKFCAITPDLSAETKKKKKQTTKEALTAGDPAAGEKHSFPLIIDKRGIDVLLT